MYKGDDREIPFVKVKTSRAIADIDNVEILEKAIALAKENPPEYRYLIDQLIATAPSLHDRRQNFGLDEGLITYKDRPQAIAKTVLDSLRYKI